MDPWTQALHEDEEGACLLRASSRWCWTEKVWKQYKLRFAGPAGQRGPTGGPTGPRCPSDSAGTRFHLLCWHHDSPPHSMRTRQATSPSSPGEAFSSTQQPLGLSLWELAKELETPWASVPGDMGHSKLSPDHVSISLHVTDSPREQQAGRRVRVDHINNTYVPHKRAFCALFSTIPCPQIWWFWEVKWHTRPHCQQVAIKI